MVPLLLVYVVVEQEDVGVEVAFDTLKIPNVKGISNCQNFVIILKYGKIQLIFQDKQTEHKMSCDNIQI